MAKAKWVLIFLMLLVPVGVFAVCNTNMSFQSDPPTVAGTFQVHGYCTFGDAAENIGIVTSSTAQEIGDCTENGNTEFTANVTVSGGDVGWYVREKAYNWNWPGGYEVGEHDCDYQVFNIAAEPTPTPTPTTASTTSGDLIDESEYYPFIYAAAILIFLFSFWTAARI